MGCKRVCLFYVFALDLLKDLWFLCLPKIPGLNPLSSISFSLYWNSNKVEGRGGSERKKRGKRGGGRREGVSKGGGREDEAGMRGEGPEGRWFERKWGSKRWES